MAGDGGTPEGEVTATQIIDPMEKADMPDSMRLKSQQEDQEEQQRQHTERGGLVNWAKKKLGIGQGPRV